MASLVADYSSDSEDESVGNDTVVNTKVKEEIKEEQLSVLPSAPPKFFATSDEVSEDDEDDTEGTTTSIKVKTEKSDTTSRLPSLAEVNPGVIGSSVFVNPFERAEQAKNQILEKHVKLTEAAPQKPASQPVCWKFKKGKCHMGKNCRFFHAVDNLSSADDSLNIGDKNNLGAMSSDQTHRSPYHPAAYFDARRRPLEQEPEDEDSYMSNAKKKKRTGINDRLVPPKKAFDALMEMRKKERPWTMPGAPS